MQIFTVLLPLAFCSEICQPKTVISFFSRSEQPERYMVKSLLNVSETISKILTYLFKSFPLHSTFLINSSIHTYNPRNMESLQNLHYRIKRLSKERITGVKSYIIKFQTSKNESMCEVLEERASKTIALYPIRNFSQLFI